MSTLWGGGSGRALLCITRRSHTTRASAGPVEAFCRSVLSFNAFLVSSTFSWLSGNRFLPDAVFEQNLLGGSRRDLKKNKTKTWKGHLHTHIVRISLFDSPHAKYYWLNFQRRQRFGKILCKLGIFHICWYNLITETYSERFSTKDKATLKFRSDQWKSECSENESNFWFIDRDA